MVVYFPLFVNADQSWAISELVSKGNQSYDEADYEKSEEYYQQALKQGTVFNSLL